ncbi:FtsX-like permease family protein [Acidimicrobiaceae bacterium USS-CC1]|uniref:FtsX-like permease family protein n=1 Tax=Acidiferrimicrobium australe TaxID=2664430 RepID=A0ABW9QRG7_9ACTN|nr:FtsX-like permease family protein [Acidiferrimicrobium australe]
MADTQRSAVAVRGTLNSNFHPAYDILVRPEAAVSGLERRAGLVSQDYLAGSFGGITLGQWRKVLRLPGVAVAAPVANVGYEMLVDRVSLNLRPLLSGAANQVFRVVPSFVVHGGLVSYPDAVQYLYVSRDRWVLASSPPSGAGSSPAPEPSVVLPGSSHPVPACPFFLFPQSVEQAAGPYQLRPKESITCAGPRQRIQGARFGLNPPGDYRVQVGFELPVLLSAIDPVQEQRLVHLAGAMVSGRYLGEHQGLSAPIADPGGAGVRTLPLIASSKTFVDESLQVAVQRLRVGGGAGLPARLAARSPGSYLNRLGGATVLRRSWSPATLYRSVLAGYAPPVVRDHHVVAPPNLLGDYWTTTRVRYKMTSPRAVAAVGVANSPSVWEPQGGATPLVAVNNAPPGANAEQFRHLHAYDASGAIVGSDARGQGGVTADPVPAVQGVFDPARLPGFAPLSRVPLQTFYPPTATGATASSRRLLHGRPLGPTTNLGGFLAQPPLLLTTIRAAETLLDPTVFADASGSARHAPIAAIQVDVAGLHGASAASRARLTRVASEIVRATHLRVDVTAGSSPTPVTVNLPAGRDQPALALREGWVRKGVATVVLSALGTKDGALAGLLGLVASIFVANISLASVRLRRAEIATLATLGWPRHLIFAAVLAETVTVGALAGLVGAGLSALISLALAGRVVAWEAIAVFPAATLVCLLAGTLAASRASRIAPIAGLAPPVRRRAARRRVRSVTGLGLANLARVPGRSLLAASGLVVGVAALAFLLAVQIAFSGAVRGDVLGNAIGLQVQNSDYLAVGVVLAVAAGSVADMLMLNLRDREPELAAMRAVGWPPRTLRHVILVEGFGIGLAGSITGAALGLAATAAFSGAPATVAPALAAAIAAGTLLATTACLPALHHLARQQPAHALATE